MRLAAIAFDVILGALFALSAAIALTGGGVMTIAHRTIGLRSPDNPLIAFAVLLALRYALLDRLPLLGQRSWTKAACDRRAAILLARVWRAQPPAAAIVVIVCAAATIVKAAFAAGNPGFFSGDDVEVQEMSQAALRHLAWPMWDLRNAAFPFAVVYPAQWVAHHLGVTDPAWFVCAGRWSVAVVSSASIWLLWKAAERLFDGGEAWSLAAAVLFAASRLQMAFGSSELPRPVSTVFVLAAFVLLQRPSAGRSLAAGVATGVAAGLRFSDAVFLLPACVQLARARRWPDVTAYAVAGVLTAAAVLGVADLLYWGDALHSTRAIVDYTLVRRLSSRGYEGPLWYLLHAAQWVSPPIFILAAVTAVRRPFDVALWAWLPVAMLSLLPHKEARYLIPAAPFVYLLAVEALRDLSRPVMRPWVPPALIAALLVGLVFDAGHWRLPRSNGDVSLARALNADLPPDAALAVEQRWRLGGRLYFGEHATVDLAPLDAEPEPALRQADGMTWLVLDSRSRGYQAAARMLAARTYAPRDYAAASTYRVWAPK